MIKNYDSQENKISIYSKYAVHLRNRSRRRNKKIISHLFFEMGGQTDLITSSLMDQAKKRQQLRIYKAMYTRAQRPAIHTAF